MQILGLLAVVVEFQIFYFYSDWLWPYCDNDEIIVDPVFETSDDFLCPKCDHKSTSKYHLDMHIEGHRDCSICGMTFFGPNSKRDLASHLKKHEIKAKKQFICDFCNVEYATKQSLQRHQNTCKKNVQKDQGHQEKYDESFEVDNHGSYE